MSNIQTGAERMPHDLSHLGFLAGQIGRLITISTTPVIAGDSFEMDAVGALRSEERFSRNAETDLVCRLLLEKKKKINILISHFTSAQALTLLHRLVRCIRKTHQCTIDNMCRTICE